MESLSIIAGRRFSRWRYLAAGVVLMVVGGVGIVDPAPAPAYAGSTTIDSFVAVNSVTVNRDRSVSVNYTKKRTVPAQANLSVAWYYPVASRDSSAHQVRYVSGKPGKVSVKFTGVPTKVMPVRISFKLSLPGLLEEKQYFRLIAPAAKTYTTTVTSALLAANVIAAQIPGVALMILPQTRVLKVAGWAFEGWSVYSAFRDAFSLGSKGCPAMKVGQIIQRTGTTSLSGGMVNVNLNLKVWANATVKNQGKPPLCNVTFTVARYS